MRAKNTRVGWAASASNLDLTREKRFQKELSDYRDARSQGVQPAGTSQAKVRTAMEISQKSGRAFDAVKPIHSVTGISGLDSA